MHKPLNGMFRVLVCRVQSRLCGLPLDAVEETLRPQPLRPLKSPAVHVQGLARIRGDWLPVVDLAGLLGLTESGVDPAPADAAAVRRYVVVRAGDRRVALAVAEVLGLQTFAAEQLRALPPLLRDRDPDGFEKLLPYAAEFKMNYPVLVGNGREDVQEAFGPLFGIPVSVIIGRDGIIAKKHSGIATKEQIEREIKTLL